MEQINIVIVDDHQLFRKGIRKVLEEMEGMRVIGEVSDGNKLRELLQESSERTDVILMDLNMPGLNGIDATELIREKYPDVKIIAMTIYDETPFIAKMVEKGADGYLLKNADINDVEKAIREVMSNGFYFNQRMLSAIRKGTNIKTKDLSFQGQIGLTSRELEILKLICQELTAPEIAEKLFISTRTVDGHRQKLLDKIGAKNTAGLVIYAMRKGLLDIGF